jgi:hypothetical protein
MENFFGNPLDMLRALVLGYFIFKLIYSSGVSALNHGGDRWIEVNPIKDTIGLFASFGGWVFIRWGVGFPQWQDFAWGATTLICWFYALSKAGDGGYVCHDKVTSTAMVFFGMALIYTFNLVIPFLGIGR